MSLAAAAATLQGHKVVAYFKHRKYLTLQEGSEFDDLHPAATLAPLSGIYRCEGCGRSIVATGAQLLPDADHHAHGNPKPIAWRLIVRSHFG